MSSKYWQPSTTSWENAQWVSRVMSYPYYYHRELVTSSITGILVVPHFMNFWRSLSFQLWTLRSYQLVLKRVIFSQSDQSSFSWTTISNLLNSNTSWSRRVRTGIKKMCNKKACKGRILLHPLLMCLLNVMFRTLLVSMEFLPQQTLHSRLTSAISGSTRLTLLILLQAFITRTTFQTFKTNNNHLLARNHH